AKSASANQERHDARSSLRNRRRIAAIISFAHIRLRPTSVQPSPPRWCWPPREDASVVQLGKPDAEAVMPPRDLGSQASRVWATTFRNGVGMATTQVNGVGIWSETQGTSGAPVILVHGSWGD